MKNEKKNSGSEMSRRQFLGTGAVAAAGIAAAGLSLPQEAEAAKVPKKWDKVADVVVVGYGAAGATAAITAHDAGAKVLMLEKAPEKYKGGNSAVSGNAVFWPNDVEKAIIYFKGMCGPYIDNISAEMIRTWAEELHKNKEWLEKLPHADIKMKQKCEFPELAGSECSHILYQKVPRMGHGYLWKEVIEPAVQTRKIPALYETPARHLIRGSGNQVIGVEAESNGKKIYIKARKAVILTCGGFENDQVTIRNYLSDLPYCYPMGTPYNTGDGIRMAQEIGADLWHMNNIAGPYFYFKAPGFEVASRLLVPEKSYIYVGRDGTRFISETPTMVVEKGAQTYQAQHGKIFMKGRYIQSPAPVPIHLVFDETVRQAGGLCGKAAGWTWSWEVLHGNLYNWSKDNTEEIRKGWIKQADTVGELAKKVNLNPDVVETTVKRYNQFCAEGRDLDFSRNPKLMKPIEKPPFCIMELVPTFVNTQGGPRRDKDARIVDVNGKPIPRLYSAGELGSIYGFQYQGGGNWAECMAFGRIAGRNAAAEKPIS